MRTKPRAGVFLGQERLPAPAATGRRESREGVAWVLYTRRLVVSREEAWSSLTDPTRLATWLGVVRADTAAGMVEVRLTAEGEEFPVEVYVLERVVPGEALDLATRREDGEPGRLRLRLTEHHGGTLVEVAQSVPNTALAPSIASWCELYLDRLVAYVEGRDPDDLDYDEYFVTQAVDYRRMFPVQVQRWAGA